MPDDSADKASILTSTKKMLGVDKEYDAFDMDILIHINTVISTLYQLGVGTGPAQFEVTDVNDTWDDLFGAQTNLLFAKSYIYLRVRQIFDPPATGFTSQAFDNQIKELEWRINVATSTTPTTA